MFNALLNYLFSFFAESKKELVSKAKPKTQKVENLKQLEIDKKLRQLEIENLELQKKLSEEFLLKEKQEKQLINKINQLEQKLEESNKKSVPKKEVTKSININPDHPKYTFHIDTSGRRGAYYIELPKEPTLTMAELPIFLRHFFSVAKPEQHTNKTFRLGMKVLVEIERTDDLSSLEENNTKPVKELRPYFLVPFVSVDPQNLSAGYETFFTDFARNLYTQFEGQYALEVKDAQKFVLYMVLAPDCVFSKDLETNK